MNSRRTRPSPRFCSAVSSRPSTANGPRSQRAGQVDRHRRSCATVDDADADRIADVRLGLVDARRDGRRVGIRGARPRPRPASPAPASAPCAAPAQRRATAAARPPQPPATARNAASMPQPPRPRLEERRSAPAGRGGRCAGSIGVQRQPLEQRLARLARPRAPRAANAAASGPPVSNTHRAAGLRILQLDEARRRAAPPPADR